MSSKRILVVDDELAITKVVAYYLKQEGYKAYTAVDGQSALDAIKATHFDLIILDLMLPDLNGLDIAGHLKANAATADIPIIMLTAKVEEEDILTGFKLKADDYITKPFSPRILMARIKSIFRQTGQTPASEQIYSFPNGVLIFPENYEVYVNDRKIDLNTTEYELLVFLAKRPGLALPRGQIVAHIKKRGFSTTERGLDLLIMNLRKKMGVGGKCIHTVRGLGYKFLEQSQ